MGELGAGEREEYEDKSRPYEEEPVDPVGHKGAKMEKEREEEAGEGEQPDENDGNIVEEGA